MMSEITPSVKTQERKAGILLHPTSFPNPYGIGDLGSSAYAFIDFLQSSGQRLWQVLPLGPTGYGDSPYQAFSSFAGQPLIISPEGLKDLDLLTDSDLADVPDWDPRRIDYGPAIAYKFNLLHKAYDRFKQSNDTLLNQEFEAFCEEESEWLEDYALFMAVKDYHKGVVWTSWTPEIAFPTDAIRDRWFDKLSDQVGFYEFIQFMFNQQWLELKRYANDKDIEIIGDIPIFVAFDSADVWGNKSLYCLDSKGFPKIVAGVPPDYFSETGQLWGNPLYDWPAHKAEGYSWWIRRIAHVLELVDVLRIDHFRGFEAYWAVPYGAPDAIKGEWLKGPGKDLFFALQNALGKNLPIIAEDLGIITPEVEELRDFFHLPGMKILQFAFEDIEENGFLPHNYPVNSVCYSGTHDNDTAIGWYLGTKPESQDRLRRYMNTDAHDVAWDFIRTCYASVSRLAVVPLQDVLALGSFARMNTPGVAMNNWQFRYTPDLLTPALIKRLYDLTDLFGRTLCIKEIEQ